MNRVYCDLESSNKMDHKEKEKNKTSSDQTKDKEWFGEFCYKQKNRDHHKYYKEDMTILESQLEVSKDKLLNDQQFTGNIQPIRDDVFESQSNQNIANKPRYCYQCGNKITPADANFCAHCGTPQTQGSISSSSSYNENSNFFEEIFSSLSERGSFSGTPYEKTLDKRNTHSISSRNSTDQTSHQNSSDEFDCSIPIVDGNNNNQFRQQEQNTSSSSPCSFGIPQMLDEWMELNPKSTTVGVGLPSISVPYRSIYPINDNVNFISTSLPKRKNPVTNECMFITDDVKLHDTNVQNIRHITDFDDSSCNDVVVKHEDSMVVPIEKDEYGDTKLHLMIQENRTKDALVEIERLKTSFNDDTFKNYLNQRNDRGMMALHTAVRNPEILDNLLQNGIDITLLDHSGNNVLHQIVFTFPSSEHDVLNLFRVVFKYQAFYANKIHALLNDNLKAFNSEGFAVVHELAKRSFGDSLEFIKKRGADLNIQSRKEKQTPLTLAARERNWKIVTKLCSLGACVNIPTSSGWYVVHAAIEDCDQDRLGYFMKIGVDIYGFKQIQSTPEIHKECELYMRRRRRKTYVSDRGKKKRRRCKCGVDHAE